MPTPSLKTTLPDPIFREEGPLLMAGFREFRTFAQRADIPEQWRRFGPLIGHITGQIGGDAYGLCLAPSNGAEGFDYLTAVAVRSLDDIPDELSGARLSRRRYAIFKHDDHVSGIGETCAAIFGAWQRESGKTLETKPLRLIERYDASFDPQTGFGGMEIWIPLKA